ncbi:hypothetical protein MSG28_009521 [Choristoneura fumiferana]|uniref:Uncharacterized protein n=1 Tax=Choristoneura fumiferana TaxID=7141 RepID=A0ACC0JBH9_CHOFU|nr:hypothetical protein MSG28_009521 [Choristoneura fumiferana]
MTGSCYVAQCLKLEALINFVHLQHEIVEPLAIGETRIEICMAALAAGVRECIQISILVSPRRNRPERVATWTHRGNRPRNARVRARDARSGAPRPAQAPLVQRTKRKTLSVK